MKKIMNYVKSFVIAAMVLTSGNVWGNTLVANTGGDAFSSINNYVCTLPASNHVTFYFEKMTHSNDFKRNNSKELQFNKETAMELRWVVNVGYTIEVSSVEIKMAKGVTWGDKYFALGNSLYDGSSKYHREKLNNQSDHTFSISGLSYGNNDVVPMYKDDYDCYLKSIKITYTLTPNAPSIVPGQEEHSIMAAIHGGDNQKVDLKNVFSRVDASHTSITYECNSANSANASITDGVFSATVAGDYTVHAIIVAKADCHEASAWSSDVTIHVAPRVSKIAPEISNTFSAYYVEDAAIDLRDLWTSTSHGAITYSLVSFTPLADAIHTGAVAPSLTEGHLLSLGQAGTVRLSLHQEEGASHLALENDAIYDLVISKRTPIISWSEDPIYFNGTYGNLYTITAGDPSLFSIESSDTQVASVAGTTLTTYNKNASTALTVTAVENYKWAGETFEKIVTPVVAPNHVTLNYSEDLFNTPLVTDKSQSGNHSSWEDGQMRIVGNAADKAFYNIIHFEGYPESVSFDYRPRQTNGALTCWRQQHFRVYESSDNSNWQLIHEETSFNDASSYHHADKSLQITTRYLKFEYTGDEGNNGGMFKNIQITELHKFETSTASLDFQQNQLNHVPAVKSFVFSHVNAGYTTTVTAPAHYQVSLSENSGYSSSVVIPNTGGDKKDDVTVYVKYLADAEGGHNDNIQIADNLGNATSVAVSATTVGKLATSIEYIGAASYAVNADNMSATDLFKVVDANGDEVATPVITLTTSDAEKIAVVSDAHAVDFLCGGSATITASYAGDETYAAAANLSKEIAVTRLSTDAFVWEEIAASYEVETEIPSLATANSGLAVTYTSNNEAVIKIVDGKIMTIGKGTAQLTAHTAGDCTYNPIEESKAINVHVHEHFIDWNQSFLDIVKNDEEYTPLGGSVALNAVAKNGGNGATGVTVTYSVPNDNEVATVSGNTLTFIGAGTTTITAQTVDDSKYAVTSVTKDIRVRNLGEACLSYIEFLEEHPGIEQGNTYEVIWENPNGDLIDPARPFQFDMMTSFWATRNFNIDIKTLENDTWVEHGSKVGNSGGWKTVNDRSLPANCTGIRFRYVDGAVGSASVRNLKLPMATFIKLDQAGSKYTGNPQALVEWTSEPVAVRYSDVPYLQYEVTDYDGSFGDISIVPVEAISNDCGANGTYNFQIKGTFTKEGNLKANIHVYSSSNATGTKIPVDLNISKMNTSVETQIGFVSPVTYLDAVNSITIDNTKWTAKDGNGDNVEGEVKLASSGNPVTFDHAGQQTLTFDFIPENIGTYNPCQFTYDVDVQPATPIVNEWPTTDEKVYENGLNLADIALKGGNATYNNQKVEGTFAWKESTTPVGVANSGTKYAVVFIPNSSDFKSVEGEVEITVTKATPEVTFPTTAPIKMTDGLTLASVAFVGGTASVDGSFAWDAPETALAEGTNSYSVTFTPTDAANYNAASADVSVTVVPAKKTYENGAWSEGTAPTAEDDVEIKSDLVINTEVEVNGLTIDLGVKVTLEVNGSLTVNGASDDLANYGDLIINAGGQVVLNDAADLQIRNLELNTELGNRETAAKSSQVANAEKLQVNGNAYIDITMDPTGHISDGYYMFTLPFEVDELNGIYWVKQDESVVKLTDDVHYAVLSYNESLSAAGNYGWTWFTGTMQPGVCYSIMFDTKQNYNTIRFMKKTSATIGDNSVMSLASTGSSATRGWNGIGNGTLTYANVDVPHIEKVQIYDHTTDTYATLTKNQYSYVVGSAFFVQVDESSTATFVSTKAPSELRAPSRVAQTTDEFMVELTKDGCAVNDDVLYISADDEAVNSYEIGRDLTKMGTPTSAKIAQIWGTSYGKTLCDVELPFEGNQATFPISIFAPVDGEYNLHIAKAINGQRLYLLEDGMLIWDLTMSDYPVSLSRGTTTSYSLMITRPQGVVTDVEEKQADAAVEKIFVGGKLYVIKNGMIFDATGKKVK